MQLRALSGGQVSPAAGRQTVSNSLNLLDSISIMVQFYTLTDLPVVCIAGELLVLALLVVMVATAAKLRNCISG